MYDKESYKILRFDCKKNAVKVASINHVISDQEVIVEYLYNCDLLNKLKASINPTQCEGKVFLNEKSLKSVLFQSKSCNSIKNIPFLMHFCVKYFRYNIKRRNSRK